MKLFQASNKRHTHYNTTDNKHMPCNTELVNHIFTLFSQCCLIIIFSVIGAKSNCSCRPELQSVFTVLSDTPTSGKYKIHPDFNLKSEKAPGSKKQKQKTKSVANRAAKAFTRRWVHCVSSVCLHIKMPIESQSRARAQERARLWN